MADINGDRFYERVVTELTMPRQKKQETAEGKTSAICRNFFFLFFLLPSDVETIHSDDCAPVGSARFTYSFA